MGLRSRGTRGGVRGGCFDVEGVDGVQAWEMKYRIELGSSAVWELTASSVWR